MKPMSQASVIEVNIHRSSGPRVETIRVLEAREALRRIRHHGGFGRVDRGTTYPSHRDAVET